MTDAADILLVDDRPAAAALGGLADGRVQQVGEPYDALMEMGRRRWSAVVLTAGQEDFAGLCRASRRLQGNADIFALCPPAAEPAVRPLVGQVITDYFIAPLGRGDLERLLRGPAGRPQPRSQAALDAGVLRGLLEAVHTAAALEARIAELVSRQLNEPVAWMDASEVPARVRPLLLAAGQVPRALVPARPLGPLDEPTQNLLEALQACLPAMMGIAQRTEALHRLAITDPLTGAYNRRYFYHLTDQILRRAAEKNARVTLLLYDIDNFKRFNDTYGYAAGDEILRDTAALMKKTTRQHDVVARIGGDEFAVLFWDVDRPRKPASRPPDTAYILAHRFRRAVSRHEYPSLGPEAVGVLTISGGLAGFPNDGKTCRELLRSADKALKEAKRTGKNAIKLVGRE